MGSIDIFTICFLHYRVVLSVKWSNTGIFISNVSLVKVLLLFFFSMLNGLYDKISIIIQQAILVVFRMAIRYRCRRVSGLIITVGWKTTGGQNRIKDTKVGSRGYDANSVRFDAMGSKSYRD